MLISNAQAFGHQTQTAFVTPFARKRSTMRFHAWIHSAGERVVETRAAPSISQNQRMKIGLPNDLTAFARASITESCEPELIVWTSVPPHETIGIGCATPRSVSRHDGNEPFQL